MTKRGNDDLCRHDPVFIMSESDYTGSESALTKSAEQRSWGKMNIFDYFIESFAMSIPVKGT